METNKRYRELLADLSKQFGEDLDFTGLLFLIGLQELRLEDFTLTKDQKMDVLHIAICKLLEPYGYYAFIGKDKDGWPHWESVRALPNMKPKDQLHLMQSAITDYFKENNV